MGSAHSAQDARSDRRDRDEDGREDQRENHVSGMCFHDEGPRSMCMRTSSDEMAQ